MFHQQMQVLRQILFLKICVPKFTRLISIRSYSDFESWANEGAYTDILTSVHFRTSIDAGYDLGYKVGQSILAIKLK